MGQGRRSGVFAASLVALTLAIAVPVARAADDEAAVTYRKHVMRTMGEQAAALGMILQKKGPPENAVFHARTLALAADSALHAFEAKVSGGEAKDLEGLYDEVRGLRDGGANGSIIGRNTFQRPREEALAMLNKIIEIYQGKA